MPFNIRYSRGPFFLKGLQPDIDAWYASFGLPNDAPRWKVAEAKGGMNDAPIDALYAEAGMSPRNKEACDGKVWTETVKAHRLAQYASTESSEKGEAVWHALSRRFFMGKDTAIQPIRLDSHEMLLECAAHAKLDMTKAAEVIEGDGFRDEVFTAVQQVRAAGINSIPVLVFEVEGLAKGSWLTSRDNTYRQIHHGSGTKHTFRQALQNLNAACRNLDN